MNLTKNLSQNLETSDCKFSIKWSKNINPNIKFSKTGYRSCMIVMKKFIKNIIVLCKNLKASTCNTV